MKNFLVIIVSLDYQQQKTNKFQIINHRNQIYIKRLSLVNLILINLEKIIKCFFKHQRNR